MYTVRLYHSHPDVEASALGFYRRAERFGKIIDVRYRETKLYKDN